MLAISSVSRMLCITLLLMSAAGCQTGAVLSGDDTIPSQPGPDAVYEVPSISGVTIDGDLTEWKDRGMNPGLLLPTKGVIKRASDLDTLVMIAWDERGLLVGMNVQDNLWVESPDEGSLWSADGVEIFLASSRGSPDLCQWVIAPGMAEGFDTLRSHLHDNRKTEALKQLPADLTAARIRTEQGYSMELLLPWSALQIKPELGREIGVQLWVNDVESLGVIDMYHAAWYPATGAHSDTKLMRRVRLSDKAQRPGAIPILAEPRFHGAEDPSPKVYVAGDAAQAGSTITVEADGKELGSGVMAVEGLRASARINLDVSTTNVPSGQLFIRRDGRLVGQLDKAMTGTRLLRSYLQGLQSCEMKPEGEWDFMFTPAQFPKIVWKDRATVRRLVGDVPLKVRWFNNALEELTEPAGPGRYMAYIEGETIAGLKIRRAMTLYCRPDDWRPWRDGIKAHIDYPPRSPIDEQAWAENRDMIAREMGREFVEYLETCEEGAILMSYLAEAKPLGRPRQLTESPEVINNDLQLALKRKILGVEGKYPPLRDPEHIDVPAPVLHAGTPEEAGVAPDTAEKIRAVCRAWYEDSKEPFAVLVARHGVIVIHELYSDPADTNITLSTTFSMASAAKAMSAMMFGEFMSQGLIGLDDPLGKYLPDFPVEGDNVLTLRHCFNHTSGLEGHAGWGGVQNPWMDNVVANGVGYLEPGRDYNYNGTGHDLAGKVMELVARKSMIRLMHENLFQPLGIWDMDIQDLASGTRGNVEALGKLSQVLVNRGAYGDKRFFSEATLEQMMPKVAGTRVTGVAGVSMIWMGSGEGALENGAYVDKPFFGKNTIGHGGASGAILLADLDNELVVTMTRNSKGNNYDTHSQNWYRAISQGLLDRK